MLEADVYISVKSDSGQPWMEEIADGVSICPACERVLQHNDRRKVVVLYPDGWRQLSLLTYRCRNTNCVWHGKRFYYNAVSLSFSEFRFVWRDGSMRFFFISPSVGVAMSWLHQMTRRMRCQFVSFLGEAEVYASQARAEGQECIVPNKAHMQLWRSWLYWRFVVRRAQYIEGGGQCTEHVNLQQSFSLTIRNASWYNQWMLRRRVSLARGMGQNLNCVVVDGNQKLRGRYCGRPVAELQHCASLGYWTATPCSRNPAPKCRRCSLHQPCPPEGPLGDESVTAHRRVRVLMSQSSGYPYEVLLKPTDSLLSGAAASVKGRWVPASQCTSRQLEDYWDNTASFISHRTCKDGLMCQTHKEADKEARKLARQNRFGGILLACTPDGYVLHAQEFTGCESIPIRYFFIADVCEATPEINLVIHDDACHVARYSMSHKSGPSASAEVVALRERMAALAWSLDRFHAKGHKDPWCRAHCHPENHQDRWRFHCSFQSWLHMYVYIYTYIYI